MRRATPPSTVKRFVNSSEKGSFVLTSWWLSFFGSYKFQRFIPTIIQNHSFKLEKTNKKFMLTLISWFLEQTFLFSSWAFLVNWSSCTLLTGASCVLFMLCLGPSILDVGLQGRQVVFGVGDLDLSLVTDSPGWWIVLCFLCGVGLLERFSFFLSSLCLGLFGQDGVGERETLFWFCVAWQQPPFEAELRRVLGGDLHYPCIQFNFSIVSILNPNILSKSTSTPKYHADHSY